MFLALKEMKYEKFRYGLITLMIFLISYLIFMLSSLAIGLASQNTQAIKSWHTQSVILNENSNINLGQSQLTKADLKDHKLNKKDAYIGVTPVVVKSKKQTTISAQYAGVKKDQFIYKDMSLLSGRKAREKYEVAVDRAFSDQGYKLGDKITFNGMNTKFKIVGFVNNAKLNIAPLAYGNMTVWKELKAVSPGVITSGVISQRNLSWKGNDVKAYPISTFLDKLPGYKAQNATFQLMIGFLFVISLIVVAVFLYILTMQKLPNYAVLRAQGIPNKTLVSATISQSLLLTVIGSVLGCIVMFFTAKVLPSTVPIDFAPWIMISGIFGMIIMGVIGGLIPVRSILKINPADAIG